LRRGQASSLGGPEEQTNQGLLVVHWGKKKKLKVKKTKHGKDRKKASWNA